MADLARPTALIVPLLLAGCLGYPGPRSVKNEDPAVKIPAIHRAVASNDRSVIPQLVEDLDSEDAAVRFAAIQALHRLTGETHGYRWTDENDAWRHRSIKRWQNFVAGRPLEEGIDPATKPAANPATRPTTSPATTQSAGGNLE